MDSFGTRKSPYLCRRKQWDDISRNSVIIMKKRQHLIRLIAAALIGFFTLSTATAGGLMTVRSTPEGLWLSGDAVLDFEGVVDV